jgi:hypothetical protein
MIARLVVQEGLDGAAHARWAAATLLDVTECAWRDDAHGDDRALGEAGPVVFVGSPAAAPADAAVVLPWSGLAAWPPESLALATEGGVTLPVPGGRVEAPSTPATLPLPWLRAAYALLSREEERLVAARDKWNCFAGTASRLFALGVLDRPLLHALAARLETRGRSVTARAWRRGRAGQGRRASRSRSRTTWTRCATRP